MAHYDLEEQEQIDTLKTWWKMYGNLVTGLALAVALGVVGWQGWNWYQIQTSKPMSMYRR
jgi:predicted negative regulator of RcsB-dependent stress response